MYYKKINGLCKLIIFSDPGEIINNKSTKKRQQHSSNGVCGGKLPSECENSRYRTFDGSCNNFDNPTWGMANTIYARLLPNNYADSMYFLNHFNSILTFTFETLMVFFTELYKPPVSKNGAPLPLAREVSRIIFPPSDIKDEKWTLATMQWGQIIAHDMSLRSKRAKNCGYYLNFNTAPKKIN